MSDTPETDAFQQTEQCAYDSMWRGFARKLERERDDLRAIFPKILEALESGACAATCSVDFLREIPREVKLVRQRLERERDEAIQARNVSAADWLNQIANADLRVTRIKRERDDLRNELNSTIRLLGAWEDDAKRYASNSDYWKAAHDNQVKLKRIISDRPDLKERAKLVAELIKERDEARFDLAFRRELYAIQELQLSDANKTILELQKK